MTRSQYEDLPRRKPVIMSRVRQLLAQHPWLVVGYSLADLDFHAFTRLVDLEMSGVRHLSLVICRDAPTAPERKHWRRLGFEIVCPADASQIDKFLVFVFTSLGTTYSANDEAVKRYVSRGTSVSDRLRRYREANNRPEVYPDQEFKGWCDMIAALLTDEEKEEASASAQAARAESWARHSPSPKYAATSEAPKSTTEDLGQLAEPLRGMLDVPAFIHMRQNELVWQINCLLKSLGARDELVESLAWALKRGLFLEAHPGWLLEVATFRLASDHACGVNLLTELMSVALERARRYADEYGESLIKEEAARLKVTLPPAEAEPKNQYVSIAKLAYSEFMDGAFEAAAAQYDAAAKEASSVGRNFETWLYVCGQAYALERLAGGPGGSAVSREQSAVKARAVLDEVERLEGEKDVAHWREQARYRTVAVLRDLVEASRTRGRRWQTGAVGMRLNNAAYYAWRSYREVAFASAPPPLRRQYLEVLVSYLDVSSLGEVLAHAPEPKAWLQDLLRESRGSFAERQKRDADIVAVFFGVHAVSTTELISRLECMPSIASVLRRDDADVAFGWLQACAKRIGVGWKNTASGSTIVDEGYWKAFSVIARWVKLTPEQAVQRAEELAEGLGGKGAGALEALYDLPWFAWNLEPSVAERFFDLLCKEVERGPSSPRSWRLRGPANALFALRRMLDAGVKPKTLRPRLELWSRVLEETRTSATDQASFGEGRRAGFLLERKLVDCGLKEGQGITELFERWFPTDGDTGQPRRDNHDRLVVLAELAEADELSPELVSRVGVEVDAILAKVEARASGGHAEDEYAPKRLLVQVFAAALERDAESKIDELQRSRIEAALLALFSSSIEHLDLLAPVLRKALWSGEGWGKVVSLVTAAIGGGVAASAGREDGDATRVQLEVLDLCGALGGCSIEDRFVDCAMKAFVLQCVSDERVSIANHAAFAIMKFAGSVTDGDEVRQVAAAILRICEDERPLVRLALADGGLALSMRANSSAIRDAALHGLIVLRADDNAQVAWVLARAAARESISVGVAEVGG